MFTIPHRWEVEGVLPREVTNRVSRGVGGITRWERIESGGPLGRKIGCAEDETRDRVEGSRLKEQGIKKKSKIGSTRSGKKKEYTEEL